MSIAIRLSAIGLLLFGQALMAQQRSQSPHGTLSLECANCHGSSGWTPVRISRAFNHARLGFPLSGAHGSADCRACHQSLDFKGADNTCASCHSDVHRGELGADCSRCHSTRSFLDRSTMSRAHQLTRFPLQGAHLSADCTACHTPAAQGGQQFVARQSDCLSCHTAEFAAAKDPDHAAGGFPRECTQCHAPTVWTRARYNHAASGFPLTGAHRAAPCDQCHVGNRFSGTATECLSCHQQDYNQTADPNHAQAGLPTNCVECHSTSSWTSGFDHSKSGFPLTGAHRTTGCLECHSDGTYAGKPTACQACHLGDFTGSTSPSHTQLGWPQTCITCHSGSSNTTAWDTGVTLPTQYHSMFNVNHEGARGDCTQCHLTSDFKQSTCSTHHHPASCTYLNRSGCGD